MASSETGENVDRERIYHSESESAYPVPSTTEEARRLNAQHKLFEDHFHDGRLLPPDISLPPNAKVLDAGTGTGIWLIDLASKLPPSTMLIGLDISTCLFPSSPLPNITFVEGSTLAPIPDTWPNSFDLIHQRLVGGAFRPSEWISALSNDYDALKPGGHLILMEAIPESLPPGSALETMWGTVSDVLRLRGVHFAKYIEDMPGWLPDTGFVDVQTAKIHRMSGAGSRDEAVELRKDVRQGIGSLAEVVAHTPGLRWEGTAAGFQAVVDEAMKEYERSEELGFLLYWFTARKPS